MRRPSIYIAAGAAMLMTIIISAVGCSGTKKSAETSLFEVVRTNVNGTGMSITVEFTKGESHNHPLMAVWLESPEGKYIETLYVAESIGKGVFRHGDRSKGQWEAGPIRRPAALPYWGHQRGIQANDGLYLPTPDQPVPDAITGPTPAGSFKLESRTTAAVPDQFKVLFEINQSWDWNNFWTNNKYPDDQQYKTSSQPSLVYEALIDLKAGRKTYLMQPAGHGHYSGADGSLNPDLSTLTTAKKIAGKIEISID